MTTAPAVLVSFPVGIPHATDVALQELQVMTVRAREYILEDREEPLRRMFDMGGIPRHHHPEAVLQLAVGARFLYQSSLPSARVGMMIDRFKSALADSDPASETEALRRRLRAPDACDGEARADGWEERTRPFFTNDAELHRRAAYQVYLDSPLHLELAETWGGFVRDLPERFTPLVVAGLAVFLGASFAGRPLAGNEGIVALKELHSGRAERLIEDVRSLCEEARAAGRPLPCAQVAKALLEVSAAADILKRRVMKLLERRAHTEDEIEYHARLPRGFAEWICDSLEDEGRIAQDDTGFWDVPDRDGRR
jgi:hypothetical protein